MASGGVPVVDGDGEEANERALRRRILDLRQSATIRHSRAQASALGAVSLRLLLLLPVLVIAAEGAAGRLFGVYTVGFAAVFLCVATMQRQRARALSAELVDAENELDLLRIELEHPERRALKMLQVNQLDLRRYYDQTLRQGRLVFYLGIACLALGFGAVGGAVYLVSDRAGTSEEQIIIASLGAVSALLANFIGVVYLRMFSEITGSVGAFHTRLVATHDLYFGNFLAAKVAGEAERQSLFGDLARDVGRSRNAHGDDVTTSV